jgi:hypothetical protein
MSKFKLFGIGALTGALLVIACFFGYQWYLSLTPAAPGVIAKEIAGETTTAVPCTTLQVYSGAAKSKLHLPAPVVEDPNKHVVAAITTPPSHHAQTVSAVTDTSTGITELFVRPVPLPWFASRRSGEIAFSSGFKGSEIVGQLELAEDFYQVKAARLGVKVQADTQGQVFVGVRAALGW